MTRYGAVLVLIVTTFGLGCETPPPEEGLAGKLGELMSDSPPPSRLDRIAPNHAETVFLNRHASVMRLRLPPGTRIPIHDAGTRAVYALHEGDLAFNNDDAPHIESYSAGEGDIWEADRYAIENPGPTDVDLLVVVRSDVGLPAKAWPNQDDQVWGASTGEVEALALSDEFTVARISVPTGEELSLDRNRPLVMYTLTPTVLAIERVGGEIFEVAAAPHRTIWFDADSHPVLKAPDGSAAVVIFEFKR